MTSNVPVTAEKLKDFPIVLPSIGLHWNLVTISLEKCAGGFPSKEAWGNFNDRSQNGKERYFSAGIFFM